MTKSIISLALLAAGAIFPQSSDVPADRNFRGAVNMAAATHQTPRQGSTKPSTCIPSPMETFLWTGVTPPTMVGCNVDGVSWSPLGAAPYFLSIFTVPVTNAKFAVARIFGTASGHNLLYTTPAGKYAYVQTAGSLTNTTTNAATAYCEVLHASTYYQVATVSAAVPPTNSPAGTPSLQYLCGPMVMLTGDSLSLNASIAGLNFSAVVVEFDSATSQIVPFWQFGVTAGNNTIATVPAGKTLNAFQYLMGSNTPGGFALSAGQNQTPSVYLVPTGQTVGPTYLIFTPACTGSLCNAGSRITFVSNSLQLNAGDSLVVNMTNTDASAVISGAGILSSVPLNP